MSGNCRFYAEKMAQRPFRLTGGGPLQEQLNELLLLVCQCEARWK